MWREGYCKQILLACVEECLQCLGHIGFASAQVCVLSRSTLLRLQVALQGNCLKRALGWVHFAGLSRSGSGSWVLHKGTDLVGPEFCPSQVRAAQATRCLVSALYLGRAVHLISSPVLVAWFPGCTVGAPSQVCRVSPLGS